jgi:hypothetical protein
MEDAGHEVPGSPDEGSPGFDRQPARAPVRWKILKQGRHLAGEVLEIGSRLIER